MSHKVPKNVVLRKRKWYLITCLIKHWIEYVMLHLIKYVIKYWTESLIKFLVKYFIKYLIKYWIEYLMEYLHFNTYLIKYFSSST